MNEGSVDAIIVVIIHKMNVLDPRIEWTKALPKDEGKWGKR